MRVGNEISVREWVSNHQLVIAFCISILIHLGCYSGWQLGKKLNWWQYHPAFLNKLLPRSNVLTKLAELKPQAPAAQRQIPMVFVEIDPAKAAAEPPKEASYY